MNRPQLVDLAKSLNLYKGNSRLNKSQFITLIQNYYDNQSVEDDDCQTEICEIDVSNYQSDEMIQFVVEDDDCQTEICEIDVSDYQSNEMIQFVEFPKIRRTKIQRRQSKSVEIPMIDAEYDIVENKYVTESSIEFVVEDDDCQTEICEIDVSNYQSDEMIQFVEFPKIRRTKIQRRQSKSTCDSDFEDINVDIDIDEKYNEFIQETRQVTKSLEVCGGKGRKYTQLKNIKQKQKKQQQKNKKKLKQLQKKKSQIKKNQIIQFSQKQGILYWDLNMAFLQTLKSLNSQQLDQAFANVDQYIENNMYSNPMNYFRKQLLQNLNEKLQNQNLINKKFQIKWKINNVWWGTKYYSNQQDAVDESIIKILKALFDYEANDIDIKSLRYNLLSFNKKTGKLSQKEIVRGGNHFIEMKSKYKIISPQSTANCFYQCITMYKAYKQGIELSQQQIVEKSRDMKRQLGNKKDYSDINDIMNVINFYGCKISVYNNIFQKVFDNLILKPNKQKKSGKTTSKYLTGQHIKLQFRNGHCLLLLPNEQPVEIKSEESIQEEPQQHLSGDEKGKEIKPLIYKTLNKDALIGVYDIECYRRKNGQQMPFCIGLLIDGQYECFYGYHCITQFWNFLSKQCYKKKVYLYAHNGAKYDITIINNELFKRQDFLINRQSFQELNGGIINMEVQNFQKYFVETKSKDGRNKQKETYQSFIFRDSVRLLAGSLDGLCKDFKIKNCKQSKPESWYMSWNKSNVMFDEELRNEIKEYLEFDCLSLYEILTKFRENVINDKKLNIDIVDCFTSASLAKKVFLKNYYMKRYQGRFSKKERQPVFELTREQDDYIRKSYFGGRTDIYIFGDMKGKLYYYDFTSLYPSVCCVRDQFGFGVDMPVGAPKFISDFEEFDIQNFFGFLRCRVYTNPDIMPLHGFKQNGKLTFAHHQGTEMTLFSEEIKLGIIKGYKYEFIDGYEYQKEPLMQDFMSEGFKNKAVEKKNGNKVLEKTHKIIINSGYGFWGLRYLNRRGCAIVNNEELHNLMEQEKIYNFNKISDDLVIVDMEGDMSNVMGKNVGIASAITSYARMRLYELMTDIEQKGYQMCYSDTDSIITNCCLKEHPDLMKKYMWDGCGKALGALKNECEDMLNSKILDKQIKNDGGDCYFDQVQILAPKVYSLKKTLVDGSEIYIVKNKGWKTSKDYQYEFNCHTELLQGYQQEQDQKQFISGKKSYVQENSCHVVVEYRRKIFTLFDGEMNVKYNKGNIDNCGKVIPFNYINGEMQNEKYYRLVQ